MYLTLNILPQESIMGIIDSMKSQIFEVLQSDSQTSGHNQMNQVASDSNSDLKKLPVNDTNKRKRTNSPVRLKKTKEDMTVIENAASNRDALVITKTEVKEEGLDLNPLNLDYFTGTFSNETIYTI